MHSKKHLFRNIAEVLSKPVVLQFLDGSVDHFRRNNQLCGTRPLLQRT